MTLLPHHLDFDDATFVSMGADWPDESASASIDFSFDIDLSLERRCDFSFQITHLSSHLICCLGMESGTFFFSAESRINRCNG
jgi:hypothetical protein